MSCDATGCDRNYLSCKKKEGRDVDVAPKQGNKGDACERIRNSCRASPELCERNYRSCKKKGGRDSGDIPKGEAPGSGALTAQEDDDEAMQEDDACENLRKRCRSTPQVCDGNYLSCEKKEGRGVDVAPKQGNKGDACERIRNSCRASPELCERHYLSCKKEGRDSGDIPKKGEAPGSGALTAQEEDDEAMQGGDACENLRKRCRATPQVCDGNYVSCKKKEGRDVDVAPKQGNTGDACERIRNSCRASPELCERNYLSCKKKEGRDSGDTPKTG